MPWLAVLSNNQWPFGVFSCPTHLKVTKKVMHAHQVTRAETSGVPGTRRLIAASSREPSTWNAPSDVAPEWCVPYALSSEDPGTGAQRRQMSASWHAVPRLPLSGIECVQLTRVRPPVCASGHHSVCALRITPSDAWPN